MRNSKLTAFLLGVVLVFGMAVSASSQSKGLKSITAEGMKSHMKFLAAKEFHRRLHGLGRDGLQPFGLGARGNGHSKDKNNHQQKCRKLRISHDPSYVYSILLMMCQPYLDFWGS